VPEFAVEEEPVFQLKHSLSLIDLIERTIPSSYVLTVFPYGAQLAPHLLVSWGGRGGLTTYSAAQVVTIQKYTYMISCLNHDGAHLQKLCWQHGSATIKNSDPATIPWSFWRGKISRIPIGQMKVGPALCHINSARPESQCNFFNPKGMLQNFMLISIPRWKDAINRDLLPNSVCIEACNEVKKIQVVWLYSVLFYISTIRELAWQKSPLFLLSIPLALWSKAKMWTYIRVSEPDPQRGGGGQSKKDRQHFAKARAAKLATMYRFSGLQYL
jgi:hypothetical protein